MHTSHMRSRSSLASIAVACALTVGLLGIAPAAGADLGGQSPQKSGGIARHGSPKAKRPIRRVRIRLPVGPSRVYYDYPYYYSRGHYPTHIGGYVYYRCFGPHRGCVVNPDYDGDPRSSPSQRARGN